MREWPWVTVAVLGGYHGINPAMGWLLAVARGMQEQKRRAVIVSLLPVFAGHELSIAAVVVPLSLAGASAPGRVRVAGAAALIGFGLYKLARPSRHPRYGGMRMSLGEVGVWAFLMSTAHGAGLMLVPVVLGLRRVPLLDVHTLGSGVLVQDAAAVALHGLAMLLVMGVVAVVVYEKVGLAALRRAWLNVNLVWAAAIVGAGVVTLFT